MSGTSAFSYLTSAELTDVGRRRKNNEDSLVRIPEAGVFCVADGMGGVQGGEVASKAVVEALQQEFTQSPDAAYAVTADASSRLVERALNSASRWIKDRADGLGLAGTGSTAVVLVFDKVTPSQGIALHAGDSRAYRIRDDKLVQLTVDHSVAAAAGLPDDSSLPAMFRGVITRAVGLEPRVQLEATAFDVAPADIFLLCSDGLSKMLSDRKLQKLLRKHVGDPLPDVARILVDEALEAGGDDNVSVVLVRVAADLPKGPTQEIPPQTLELEKLVFEDMAPAHAPVAEDRDATGQTAETGVHTASTMADAGTPSDGDKVVCVTPTTPDSGKGGHSTPPTPVSPRRTPLAPAPADSTLKWVVALAALAVVAAGVWGFLALRQAQEAAEQQPIPPARRPAIDIAPATRTNISGVATNPGGRRVDAVAPEHAGTGDWHGGAQE